jgi:hypothetical protein
VTAAKTYILPESERAEMVSRLTRELLTTHPGKRVEVRIQKYVKRRTLEQSSALFGLAYKIMSEETGMRPNDLHTHFCGEYFGWLEVEIMGKTFRRPVRTTTTDEDGNRDIASTVVFSGLFEFVQQQAAELGIFIPDPDPNWRVNRAKQG